MKYLFITLIFFWAITSNLFCQSDTLLVKLKNNKTEKIPVTNIYRIKFSHISSIKQTHIQDNNLLLNGNYPNPFGEQTNIEFEIAIPGNVRIFIYDNKGNQIQTLECNNCSAGKNEIQWNCLDINNERVQAGVYYYEVRFGKEICSQKMILIK